MSSTALWYATRASGLMALVLLTSTMVLGITTTTRARARNWPGFAQQEMHRRISMIAVVFVGIHVVTSVLDTYVNISWAAIVVPFTSSYKHVLGRRRRHRARPHDRGLRHQPPPGPDAPRDVARRPLAGLSLLAGGAGPHVRHGHRLPARAGSSRWASSASPPLPSPWRGDSGRSPARPQ